MVEQKGSFEETIPEYELGQWFRPFEGYEDMTRLKLGKPPATTEFVYRRFSISRLARPITATLGYHESGSPYTSLVVSASGDITVLSSEFLEAQRRISARLLNPCFISDFDLYGFSVELKFSEDGRIFTNPFVPFTSNGSSMTYIDDWRDSGITTGQRGVSLFFPEREYNFNQVNVRVVPTPVETAVAGRV